jgi:hypothetical protein
MKPVTTPRIANISKLIVLPFACGRSGRRGRVWTKSRSTFVRSFRNSAGNELSRPLGRIPLAYRLPLAPQFRNKAAGDEGTRNYRDSVAATE